MAMNSALPKHEISTAKGTSAIVVNGDSQTQQPLIHKTIPDYDIVMTSPPWIGYNNACNGVGGVDLDQWREINNAVGHFCAEAKGIDGVRGLVEMPGGMSGDAIEVVQEQIRNHGLRVWKHKLEAVRYVNFGHNSTHEWWLIVEPSLLNDAVNHIIAKIKEVSPILARASKSANRLTGLQEWMKGEAEHHGRPQPLDIPNQFLTKHFNGLLDTFVPKPSTVLDPYAGTGTAIELCLNRSINAIGIEKYPSYFSGLKRRLDSLQGMGTRTTYGRGTRVASHTLLYEAHELEELDLVEEKSLKEFANSSAELKRLKEENYVANYRSKVGNRGTGRGKHLYRKPEKQGV